MGSTRNRIRATIAASITVIAIVAIVALGVANHRWVGQQPRAHVDVTDVTVSPPPDAEAEPIGNLADVREENTDAGPAVRISAPKATGAAKLTEPIERYIAKTRAAFEAAASSSERASLDITWRVINAAGPYLGIAVQSSSAVAGEQRTETTSFYLDTATNTTIDGRQLLTEQAKARTQRQFPHEVGDVRFSDTGRALVVGEQGARPLPATEDNLTPAGLAISRAVAAHEKFTELPAPPPPPAPPAKKPAGRVDCSKAKCIALTFDDGPAPSTTGLLTILRKHNVRATFFMLGNSVKAHPDIAAAVAKGGHAIGNHTMNHPQLTKLSDAQIAAQLDGAAAEIKNVTGTRPTMVRPPYGDQNKRVLNVLKSRGESSILWSVDTLDWKHRNPATTVQRALAGAKPGGIILMHDIHPTTIKAVEGVITGLKQRGFTLVTVPELHG